MIQEDSKCFERLPSFGVEPNLDYTERRNHQLDFVLRGISNLDLNCYKHIDSSDPMDAEYQPPKWAGKSPQGFHLDVTKDGKLFQKLMIDEKSYYLFGRNMALTDICTDHGSCSRVHAALTYHKHLNRFFLTDLGSIDSTIKFGASTRLYTLREKPNSELALEEDTSGNLPDTEYELDSLTEYNTVQNKKVVVKDHSNNNDLYKMIKVAKRKSVTFNEEEEVINLEDFDPTVGKFRNLVQSTIIESNPNKKQKKLSDEDSIHSPMSFLPRILPDPAPDPNEKTENDVIQSDVTIFPSTSSSTVLYDKIGLYENLGNETKKKKYAKESWPGAHT
ncbi:Nuclear inhibitor of protein phosphatase 1 [Blomia tropicalis]|nr:Nuclear inhibitor of protein phosphatase 1 [Blomia tropicalis]